MKRNEKMLTSRSTMDLLIRLTVILYICFLCVRVFAPFALMLLWAMIIAVVLFPLQQKIVKRMRGKQGRAATTLVLIGCLLLGLPIILLAVDIIDHIKDAYQLHKSGEMQVREPNEKLNEWPFIGSKIYDAWNLAYQDFNGFIEQYKDQLNKIFKKGFGMVTGILMSTAIFMGAIILSGFMMAYGEQGSKIMLKIANRLTGNQKGEDLINLSVSTIRSVTNGVIGVALIQGVLIGIVLLMADIPAAGILALLIMFLAILQLPAAIVVLPAIIYMWAGDEGSTISKVVYTILLSLGGLVDNVLRPVLLGRGVDAPMPVILIGALGGMMASGLIGLFLGATLLAVAYRIFMDWVDQTEETMLKN
ncbi:MAG: AI-2E family transporter [Lentisphaeria bacterium]|nr:AI-2E family transporter [Lentisphaeria bacterium]